MCRPEDAQRVVRSEHLDGERAIPGPDGGARGEQRPVPRVGAHPGGRSSRRAGGAHVTGRQRDDRLVVRNPTPGLEVEILEVGPPLGHVHGRILEGPDHPERAEKRGPLAGPHIAEAERREVVSLRAPVAQDAAG